MIITFCFDILIYERKEKKEFLATKSTMYIFEKKSSHICLRLKAIIMKGKHKYYFLAIMKHRILNPTVLLVNKQDVDQLFHVRYLLKNLESRSLGN